VGSSCLSGLWVPLVTPFRGGLVDEAALRRLVQHLAQAGVTGFVVCGSTGEAASLTHAEQLAVLDAVLQEADGRPVMMGLAGTQTAEMRGRLRDFCSRPLAGVLLSAPYYLRPSQAGIVQHFVSLADAATCPVVAYDIPARTGVRMELATLRELSHHPRIVALKDCGGDPEKTRALVEDGRLQVLAGDDADIFATLCMGGAGAIAASAHLLPRQFVELVSDLRAGRLADARRRFHALAPLTHALFAEPSPSPLKAVLAEQGWMLGELRPPHTAASAEAVRQALHAHADAARRLAA
jgi:4-hydroxy-tetrahydrodipicolinate synthase